MKYALLLLSCTLNILNSHAQKIKDKEPGKTCITASCCKEDSQNDAMLAFAEQAGSHSFASMHEAPLDFVLENQKGVMVTFPAGVGGPGNAYEIKAASPSKNYLLVIQEWWGLNDYIKQEAESYYSALDGKVNVIAVDLYDGKIATTPDSAMSYIKTAMGSNRKENILDGAIGYAGQDANIYTVGWCFGGMMSLQTGIMAGKQGKATIMYYGQPEMDEAKLKKLNADVLGIFGTLDKSIPNETVDQFAAKMKSLGKSFQLERYEAPHAFANPSNPSYNAAAREDAFKKSIAFLKSHLK